MEVKDKVHERTVDALRSSGKYERQRLQEQEKVLNYVLDEKQKEAQDAKARADRYLTETMLASRKEREKSIEAETWKNACIRTELDKSINVEVERDMRRS